MQLESCEPLLGLLDRAAQVLQAVNDQGGCADRLDVFERAHVPELRNVRAALEVAAQFVVPEAHADVGGAAERDQVADAAVGHGHLKAAGVRGDPVGHVAAVTAAHHAGPGRVQARFGQQRRVEEGQQVVHVDAAPAAPDVVAPLLAVTERAARVAVTDPVTLMREQLELVHEAVPVGGVRPAVDVQQGRHLTTLDGRLTGGQQHPTLTLAQFVPESHPPGHERHERQTGGAVGDLDAVQVDLGGLGGTLRDVGRVFAHCREAGHHPQVVVQARADLAVQGHAEQAHTAAHRVRQREGALVGPDRAARKSAHVQVTGHVVAGRAVP